MTRRMGGIVAAIVVAAVAAATASEGSAGARFQSRTSPGTAARGPKVYAVREGVLSIQFDPLALEQLGWRFIAKGAVEESPGEHRFALAIRSSSTLQIYAVKGVPAEVVGGVARARGAILLIGAGDRVVIGNPAVGVDADGIWTVTNMAGEPGDHHPVFELSSVVTDLSAAGQEFQVFGDLVVAESWADYLGFPEAAGRVIGSMTLQASLAPSGPSTIFETGTPSEDVTPTDETTDEERVAVAAIGPDIITVDLDEIASYGSEGGISAFAVGTIACNLGDEPANWYSWNNQHPVIPQAMFRLKNHRFEQIGMSWIKHGFYALQNPLCGMTCQDPQAGGSLLGVRCSDPYNASLNGTQSMLGPRGEVNAHTGYFPYPYGGPDLTGSTIERRLQVHDTDLDPTLNPGAVYFVDGHYLSSDEALAGNGNNSASYRRISIMGPDGNGEYGATLAGTTQAQQPAIRAWLDYEEVHYPNPSVVETDVQIPGEGLLILAAKAIDLGGGLWQYEYALQNLNSDRSAKSFSVPLFDCAIAFDIGFHDVDYHSGEIYDLTDWPGSVTAGVVTWSTESYAINPDANALRWGTLYNFWFRSNASPDTMTVTIGLFKPGSPETVTAETIGPAVVPVDCNANGVADPCDIADGTSYDTDSNGIPDECGACCNVDGCFEITEGGCKTLGKYRGDGTTCEEECPDPIPAVTEWGLVVMALLVVAAATMLIQRGREVAKHARF